MSPTDYRALFLGAADGETYLRQELRLPGPRANLELLWAAAEEIDERTAEMWAARPVLVDPTDVFVICVGLVALGRFVAGTRTRPLDLLRRRAADDEWRIREAAAPFGQRLCPASG